MSAGGAFVASGWGTLVRLLLVLPGKGVTAAGAGDPPLAGMAGGVAPGLPRAFVGMRLPGRNDGLQWTTERHDKEDRRRTW